MALTLKELNESRVQGRGDHAPRQLPQEELQQTGRWADVPVFPKLHRGSTLKLPPELFHHFHVAVYPEEAFLGESWSRGADPQRINRGLSQTDTNSREQ